MNQSKRATFFLTGAQQGAGQLLGVEGENIQPESHGEHRQCFIHRQVNTDQEAGRKQEEGGVGEHPVHHLEHAGEEQEVAWRDEGFHQKERRDRDTDRKGES